MTATANHKRKAVLAEIAREELVRLVYGPITNEQDRAKLAELADAAGVRLEDVLPASGEPGHDPRTHRPAATAPEPAEPERTEPREPSQEEFDELAEDVEELETQSMVAAYASDVAELLDTDMDEAEAIVRGWGTASRPGIVAFLLAHGSEWARLQLVTELAA
ncbi:hypothetical protein O4J56_06825 [Nocardiopsis sp. RSe5-2]|uniref:Uncharacterized protein n=1 Tax=Nocardiopsis endophytica TaxID=3018445 RepID=A0ABT4U072_9ACTN|nr:hypothetical protein [Nocardiopsis endophytica]MDA2810348.1 hypothetical protein [Nocardiopsis endophytica]